MLYPLIVSYPLNDSELRTACNHVLSKMNYNSSQIIQKRFNVPPRSNRAFYEFHNKARVLSSLFIKVRRLPSRDSRIGYNNGSSSKGVDWDFRKLEYKANRYYVFVCSNNSQINTNSLEICAMSPADIKQLLGQANIPAGFPFEIEVSFDSNGDFVVMDKKTKKEVVISRNAIGTI